MDIIKQQKETYSSRKEKKDKLSSKKNKLKIAQEILETQILESKLDKYRHLSQIDSFFDTFYLLNNPAKYNYRLHSFIDAFIEETASNACDFTTPSYPSEFLYAISRVFEEMDPEDEYLKNIKAKVEVLIVDSCFDKDFNIELATLFINTVANNEEIENIISNLDQDGYIRTGF